MFLFYNRYQNLCPKACENFLQLCDPERGLTKPKYQYKGCLVHRLVKNGWIQTGDVVDSSGKNSVSPMGSSVPDECFSVDHSGWRGGTVSYSSEGAHTNRSQFFITLGSCPWLNQKFEGFGRVIQGYHVLRKMNEISTNNQVPARDIKIIDCGTPPELKEGHGGK
jgi:cyclophilin family peptidyl-prolyl cis-trans isomerase